MYGWLWRRLPGPPAVRVLTALTLALAVSAVLVFLVFPWVDQVLGVDDAVIGAPPASLFPTWLGVG